VNEDLICEVSAAIALGGWQGLADNPGLVEAIMFAVPYMEPPADGIVRAIYQAQQMGRRVVVSESPAP
jgi:hypothetical protein